MKYTLKNWHKKWWKNEFGKVYFETFNPLFTAKRVSKEVDFIIKSAELNKDQVILDLACGHGRHAIELALRGYNIIGLDYSNYFLKIARLEAKRKKAEIKFVFGNMLKLNSIEKYDVILLMFSSFGYFSDKDNKKLLANIYKALKPEGRLLIDVVNADLLFYEIVSEGREIEPGLIQRIRKSKVDEYDLTDIDNYHVQDQLVHLHRLWKRGNQRGTFDYFMVHYHINQHREILKRLGFTLRRVWGDYNFSKWSNSSWRTIVLAEKSSSLINKLRYKLNL